MNLEPYRTFVKQKEAPVREMSIKDFRLMHCALGLGSEFLELSLADDSKNYREELEDICWYLILTADVLEYDLDLLPEDFEPLEDPEDDFIIYLERFISLVKKHTIYGKDKTSDINTCFYVLWIIFIQLLVEEEYRLDDVIEANMKKLNTRYAASFSQEESETRKDKQ